jgi:hypothetical protein
MPLGLRVQILLTSAAKGFETASGSRPYWFVQEAILFPTLLRTGNVLALFLAKMLDR